MGDTHASNKGQIDTAMHSFYSNPEILEKWGYTQDQCGCCGVHNSKISGLLIQCGRCKVAYYCGMKCFNDDMERHKKFCLEGLLDEEPTKLTHPEIPQRTESSPSPQMDEMPRGKPFYKQPPKRSSHKQQQTAEKSHNDSISSNTLCMECSDSEHSDPEHERRQVLSSGGGGRPTGWHHVPTSPTKAEERKHVIFPSSGGGGRPSGLHFHASSSPTKAEDCNVTSSTKANKQHKPPPQTKPRSPRRNTRKPSIRDTVKLNDNEEEILKRVMGGKDIPEEDFDEYEDVLVRRVVQWRTISDSQPDQPKRKIKCQPGTIETRPPFEKEEVDLREIPARPTPKYEFEKPEWVLKSPLRRTNILEMLLQIDQAMAQSRVRDYDRNNYTLTRFNISGSNHSTTSFNASMTSELGLLDITENSDDDDAYGTNPPPLSFSKSMSHIIQTKPEWAKNTPLRMTSNERSASVGATNTEWEKPEWTISSPLRTTERGKVVKSEGDLPRPHNYSSSPEHLPTKSPTSLNGSPMGSPLSISPRVRNKRTAQEHLYTSPDGSGLRSAPLV